VKLIPRPIGAFGTPAWRRLFAAYLISSLGDELTRIALFARADSLSSGVDGLAAVAIALSLPSLVFGPLAGMLADPGARKRWLVLTDLGRVPVMFGIAFCSSLSAVVALTIVLASLTALFRPVEAAWEPDLLEPAEIMRSNALRGGSRQLLSILGPGLAGLILAAGGVSAALMLDAATYALSAVVLATIPERTRRRSDTGVPLSAARGGWRQALHEPGLRVLFITQAVLVLLLGMQGPLLYDFVALALNGKAGSAFAGLMAALGVGGVAGSVLIGRWTAETRSLAVIFAILAADGAALLGFTYTHRFGTAALFMVVMGLVTAVTRILVRSYLQSVPPPETRGLILGLFEGAQGPLAVLSLVCVIPLAATWESASLLRAIALAEIVVATAGLLLVRTFVRTGADDPAAPTPRPG
jgi:MFS family permease